MPFEAGHALVIGVSTYEWTPSANVPIVAKDAAAVASLLRDPFHAGYPTSQVTLVPEAETTTAGLRSALGRLASTTTAGATALIFYAGHGGYGADGRYYLTSSETEIAGGKVAPGTGLADHELLGLLQAIPAERLLVIFNACYAGTTAPHSLSLEPQPIPTATANAILGTGKGRVLLTACAADQRSLFDPGADLTLFTSALLQGLRGEGLPQRGGGISLYDLYPAVYEHVDRQARMLYGLLQQPQLTVQQGQGPLIVALHPAARGPSLGLDSDPPTPPLPPGLRAVGAAESRAALIMLGGTFEQTTIHSRTYIAGDVNTGGDFVGGDSHTFNMGAPPRRARSDPGAAQPGFLAPADPLVQVLADLVQEQAAAQRAGRPVLGQDLDTVLIALESAARAAAPERRAAKLRVAQAALEDLAHTYPALLSLLERLRQIS